MFDVEQTIRERAYHMWNDAGRPEGNPEAFWLDAQRELLAQSVGQIAVVKSRAAKKPSGAKTPAPRKRKVA